MSIVIDPRAGPSTGKLSSAEEATKKQKDKDQVRQYRWAALFGLLMLLVWIAWLALLGYGIGWLYFWLRGFA